MVRSPSVDKNGLKRGAWSEEEDKKLIAYVQRYGHWNWRQLPRFAGLARCGKSCRLRYLNYLRPGLKKGAYSKEEEEMIIKLRQEHGNKWSTIATKLPGRTDNEIKNYWNSHLKKSMQMQQDPKSSGKTNGRSQKIQVTDQKEQDSSVSISGSTDWKPETDHHADADTAMQEISSSKSYDYSGGQENYSFSSEESVFPKFFEGFWTEPFFPSTPDRQISTPTSYNNSNGSRVLDLDLEDWIAENELMSFETEEEQSLVNYFQGLSTDAKSDALISPSTSSSSTNSSISCTNSSIQPVLSDLSSSSSSSINDLISTSLASYNSTVVMNSQESSSADAFGGFWNIDEPAFSSDFTSLPPAEEGIVFPFNNINSSLEYYDIYDLFNQF